MGELSQQKVAQEIERRLRAIREDPERLMRYDLDGDGRIDDGEWEQVRRMVEGEVLTELWRGGETLPAPAAAPPSAQLVAQRYEIIRDLGQGGMAHTYLARDRQSGHEVAVKQLALERVDDWKAVELFEREGKILEQLDHPAIPRYVDAFYEEGGGESRPRFYLVQEYVEGVPLDLAVSQGRRFTEAQAVDMLGQVLGVLEYLHGLNPPVIHRDLKPSNLILRPDGQVAVIDFGAIQEVLTTATTVGSTFVGTSGYMAPEQFMGRSVPATDIYALGATFVHLLSHRHPADLPLRRMRLEFRQVVSVSEPLLGLLEQMLEPAVEDRLPGAGEVLARLASLSGEATPAQGPPAAGPKASPRPDPAAVARGRLIRAAAVVLGLVALAALVSVLLTPRRPTPPRRSRPVVKPRKVPTLPRVSSRRGNRTLPLTWRLTSPIEGLTLKPHGSSLSGSSRMRYYRGVFDVHNTGDRAVEELQVQLHLLDADGKLVAGRNQALIRSTSSPELRPRERRSFSLSVYKVPEEAHTARVTVVMATRGKAAATFPAPRPLQVVWEVPRPDGVDLVFAIRRLKVRRFSSSGAVSHVLHLDVQNRGTRPVTLLKVQKRMYDDAGAMVKTSDKYVTTTTKAPLRPGQTEASVVLTYSKVRFSSWKLAVTDLR